jgi:nitroreductase
MKTSETKNVILDFIRYPHEEMIERSEQFYQMIRSRRSVREFSDKAVPKKIIENCIRAACTAPSGANMQPWHFVVVANSSIKSDIRRRAEEEERLFYEKRAPQEWLDALAPLGTNTNKPFLEVAPYLIVIFLQRYHLNGDGRQIKHYYPHESVGIACGMLITALHHSGLATLTHTPSPMNFLNEILKRPASEKPYLVLVTGYPKDGTMVPNIQKKKINETLSFLE